MLLSLDFPRDGEVLEPSGIQAKAGTGPPDPFDVAQGRGEQHSRTAIKTFGGDALGSILMAVF